jgi:ribonuclease HI
MKYYAVQKGRETGIFTTWSECKHNVHGFSGAVFKSFESLEEAEAFLNMPDVGKRKPVHKHTGDKTVFSVPASSNNDPIAAGEPYAFTDGSFNAMTGVYGCGGFLIENGNTHVLMANGNDKELSSVWNIAGEILGAETALKTAQTLHLKKITLFYDYMGIEQWGNRSWKNNKKAAYVDEYMDIVQKLRESGMEIVFHKVKGHSGVAGNEAADAIARYMCGASLGAAHLKLLKKYNVC